MAPFRDPSDLYDASHRDRRVLAVADMRMHLEVTGGHYSPGAVALTLDAWSIPGDPQDRQELGKALRGWLSGPHAPTTQHRQEGPR